MDVFLETSLVQAAHRRLQEHSDFGGPVEMEVT